jgi:hypothetical protein
MPAIFASIFPDGNGAAQPTYFRRKICELIAMCKVNGRCKQLELDKLI